MPENLSALAPAAPDRPAAPKSPTDSAALEEAFAALERYRPGSARGLLVPIDQAVVAALGNPSRHEWVEPRLAALLRGDLSVVAKEYVCSKLGLIGSPASVSALSPLLGEKELAYASRAALEAMPCPEAVEALRAALPKVSGLQKVGIINSLRKRRDAQSVAALAPLLESADGQVASAAAAALGEIGSPGAAEALAKTTTPTAEPTRRTVADARLVCAEHLLANGHKTEALAIYKALSNSEQPKPVQLAAKRGLLMVAQKK